MQLKSKIGEVTIFACTATLAEVCVQWVFSISIYTVVTSRLMNVKGYPSVQSQ